MIVGVLSVEMSQPWPSTLQVYFGSLTLMAECASASIPGGGRYPIMGDLLEVKKERHVAVGNEMSCWSIGMVHCILNRIERLVVGFDRHCTQGINVNHVGIRWLE